MSEPMTSDEIEDVLSSIRRLVSEDGRRPGRAGPVSLVSENLGRLILTPALRVVDREAPARSGSAADPAEAGPVPAPDEAGRPAPGDADAVQGSDAGPEAASAGWPSAGAAVDAGAERDSRTEAVAGGAGGDGSPVSIGPAQGLADGGDRHGEAQREADRSQGPDATDAPADPSSAEGPSGPDSSDGAGAPSAAPADRAPAAVADRIAAVLGATRAANWEPEQGDPPPVRLSWIEVTETAEEAEPPPQFIHRARASAVTPRPQDAGFPPVAEKPEDPALIGMADDVLDEAVLREIVRTVLREELHGNLGERITRNIRKLVRAEVHRALTLRDYD